MEHQLGDRRFLKIPGSREEKFELPPLLLCTEPVRLEKALLHAKEMAEDELPDAIIFNDLKFETTRLDLALQLIEAYLEFTNLWSFGNCVDEWIRQCENTFKNHSCLRPLLREDIWPYSGKFNFIRLLEDKRASPPNIDLHLSYGLKLAFKKPAPINCFSHFSIFTEIKKLGRHAYNDWVNIISKPEMDFPPERFNFQIVKLDQILQ